MWDPKDQKVSQATTACQVLKGKQGQWGLQAILGLGEQGVLLGQMENQGTQDSQVSMGLRVTQGYQAQKGTLEWEDLLVSQAPEASQEIRDCRDKMVNLAQEVSLAYQVPGVPSGRQVFQDFLGLKVILEIQVLPGQLA